MKKLKEMLGTWALALLTAALVVVVVFFSTKSFGQERTFDVGKVNEVRALVCFEKDAAVVIAKMGNMNHPFVNHLAVTGRCVIIHGYGQYVKKVASEGVWSVWEVKFSDTTFYEATDWKPRAPPSA